MSYSGGRMSVQQTPGSVSTHARDQTHSQLRLAEQQLADAEARYRALVENAVEGMFRTTPDGRFLMANRALAVMLGYETVDQLLAARPNVEHGHYVRPEERARFKRLLDVQGLVKGFEYEAFRCDGTTIWLRDHVRAVPDANGAILYYEGTVEDVTARRRSEQLLDLRARQQAAVARLGEAAVAGGDLAALLDRAVALVVDTLDVDCAQVLELRAAGDLVIRAANGWSPSFINSAIPGGRRSQAGLTVLAARPVVVEDLRTDPRFETTPSHLASRGILSGLSVVIGTPERPYGVLSAHATDQRAFSVDDTNFLQSVASLLAAAIERRRSEDVRHHLLARAISAQEEERQRVARELHDETGQALTAILVGLRNVEAAATGTGAQQLAADLLGVIETTMRDVGRIARGLRPAVLDDLGLIPALQRYAEDLQVSRGLRIEIRGPETARFPHAVETTLYRVLQEALTNVAAHAQARSAEVTIRPSAGTVQALVRDDGVGFDLRALVVTARRQPLGLIGMQERASLLGGSVIVDSRPGAGTTVSVTLPLP